MSQMQREREAELDRMQEALSRVVETHRTPNGMIISLPNSVFRFDFDKADLNQHNRELLSRISGILLTSKAYGLSVFGYTDDVGSAEYNQQLSLRRATAVKDYLVQAGIDRGIVNVKGYGKTSPLVENASNDSRSKNRRVEIALTDSSVHF
jgi:outer membrane protein OmpA-like peptidoglycan-associated protein